MSGITHDQAVATLGSCDCVCHRSMQRGHADCWCHGDAPSPHRIQHNDAVAHFGHCPSPTHGFGAPCAERTDVTWKRAFERLDAAARDRRIRSGNIRSSSDVRRAIQLGVLPR